MNPKFMEEHGVKFQSRLPAFLVDYEFKFSVEGREGGAAICTIVPSKGKIVHGALYHLSEGGLERLDELILHGAKKGSYEKIEVPVVLSASSTQEQKLAKTYIAQPEIQKEGLEVNQQYLKLVLAATDVLPEHYVKFLKSFQA